MEFFRIVNVKTTEERIVKTLKIEHFDKLSTLVFLLDKPDGNLAKTGGLWGEFTLRRNEIKGGLRFDLVECPNALAWTITTGYSPARESVVVHMTINRERKPDEFIEEINEFLDDHTECLLSVFKDYIPMI